MTYSSFAEKMLVGLYQETVANEASGEFSLADIAHKYGLSFEPRWINRVAEEWGAEGLASGRRTYDSDAPAIAIWMMEISGRGMRTVEAKYGSKDGVGTVIEPVQQVAISEPVVDGSSSKISSSAWTGLPSNFELSEQRVRDLVSALDIVEQNLASAGSSQEERAQARAYVIAMRSLAEAPEPPADLIWELLQRANNLAGIATFFVSIFALFQAAAH